MAVAQIWIGTSGWVYRHWRGVFYPDKLPTTRWLTYYSERFATVELNNSFYRLPSERAFDAWREQSPAGFCFAVKASRYLTHLKKLRDPQEPLDLLLSRARHLGPRLGPILYQLPPFWQVDLPRLRAFLDILPREQRHALEFRHSSWLTDEVFALLEQAGVAYCIISMPDHAPVIRTTASFVYLRMHGAEALYGSNYPEEQLQWWADHLERFAAEGRESYIYYNNDASGYAVQNAFRLRDILEARGCPVAK